MNRTRDLNTPTPADKSALDAELLSPVSYELPEFVDLELDQSLSLTAASKTTDPGTSEEEEPGPVSLDFSVLAYDWSLVSGNGSGSGSGSHGGDNLNESTGVSVISDFECSTSSPSASASASAVGNRCQELERDLAPKGLLSSSCSPQHGSDGVTYRRHYKDSPDYKRKKRQEAWEEVAARILSRNDDFFKNWHPVVLAMKLKEFQRLEDATARRFAHDDEFEEFLRCILHEWQAACLANLVGFLIVCGFPGLGDIIRAEVRAVSIGISAEDTKLKRRSWIKADPATHTFVGRQVVLLQLHWTVMDAHRLGYRARPPIIVIAGLGGMGKTQLVLFYARTFADYFDEHVFLVAADDKMSLRQSFMKVAVTDLGLEIEAAISDVELANRCYEHFSVHLKRKSLFIFDNAESYSGSSDGVAEFLPAVGRLTEGSLFDKTPNVIITSRAAAAAWPEDYFKTLALGPWEPPESLDYLRARLPYNGISDTAYQCLAKDLGHYPLALRQATGFIKKSVGFPFLSLEERIDDFLRRLQSQSQLVQKEVLDFKSPAATGYQDTVFAILRLAMSKIDEPARQMLTQIVLLGPDRIPVQWLVGSEADNIEIEALENYSLVTIIVDEGGGWRYLQAHRIVQKFVRSAEKSGLAVTAATRLLAILAPRIQDVCRLITRGSAPNLNEVQKLCVTHAKEFCTAVLDYNLLTFDELPGLHFFAMDVFRALGALDHFLEAATLADGFLRLYTARGLQLDSDQVLEAGIVAGRTCFRPGPGSNLPKARQYFEAVRAAVDIARMTPIRREHVPFWLEVTFHIGWACNRMSTWPEARIYYNECLTMAAAILNSNDSGSQSESEAELVRVALRYKLFATSGIANLDRTQFADLSGALAQYKSILSTPDWETLLDDDERVQLIYQQTAIVLVGLGALGDRIHYAEAVRVLQRNVDRLQAKYGPQATTTLIAKIKLIEGLLDDGQLGRAENLAIEIYEPVLQKLGPINTQTFQLEESRIKIREMHAMAAAKSERDRLAALDDVHTGHMKILEDKLGKMRLAEGHVTVIHTERRLCGVYAAKGEWAKALEEGRKVLQKQRALGWGSEHGNVQNTEKFLKRAEDELAKAVNSAPQDVEIEDPGNELQGEGAQSAQDSKGNSLNSERRKSSKGPFTCPRCPVVNKNLSDIRRHVKKHGILKYDPSKENPILEEGDPPEFQCPTCDYSTDRGYRLRGHEERCPTALRRRKTRDISADWKEV